MYKYRRKHHRELQLDLGKILISLVMLSNIMENIYQYTFRNAIFILAHLQSRLLIFPCRDLIPSPVVTSPHKVPVTSCPSIATLSSHFHPLELFFNFFLT